MVDRLGDELCIGRDGQSLESVVGDLLRTNHQTLAIAESCTGGLLSQMITAVPGSSDYFLEAAVTYTNRAKIARLGVAEATLAKFGAVSEQVAGEMAVGMRRTSGADWTISITGVAGPGGGSVEKPVGLVFIGIAGPGEAPPRVHRHNFPGEREIVRMRSARNALNWLRLELLGK